MSEQITDAELAALERNHATFDGVHSTGEFNHAQAVVRAFPALLARLRAAEGENTRLNYADLKTAVHVCRLAETIVGLRAERDALRGLLKEVADMSHCRGTAERIEDKIKRIARGGYDA